MAKFKYVGDEVHNLAGIGKVSPGDVFDCSSDVGEALEKNAPDLYERQKADPVETPAEKAARLKAEAAKAKADAEAAKNPIAPAV